MCGIPPEVKSEEFMEQLTKYGEVEEFYDKFEMINKHSRARISIFKSKQNHT